MVGVRKRKSFDREAKDRSHRKGLVCNPVDNGDSVAFGKAEPKPLFIGSSRSMTDLKSRTNSDRSSPGGARRA